jgi:hypothetical protein
MGWNRIEEPIAWLGVNCAGLRPGCVGLISPTSHHGLSAVMHGSRSCHFIAHMPLLLFWILVRECQTLCTCMRCLLSLPSVYSAQVTS